MALVALSASGIQSAAAVVLQRSIDANWRGAYEVLVTAKGTSTDVNGLLLPNSLGDAQHSLTLADVKRIRALDGVGVAAPIGEVVVPGFKLAATTMTLPVSAAGANEAPQAFRLTTVYTTNDGLGERVVSEHSQNVVVDESENSPEPGPTAESPGPAVLANGIWGIDDSSISIPEVTNSSTLTFDLTGGAPSATGHVTLVDPVAEKELLGKTGAFLDPLIKLKPTSSTTSAQLLDWASVTHNAYAKAFLKSQTLTTDGPKQAAVPLLVSSQPSAQLTMHLSVESFGSATLNPDFDGFNSPYILPRSLAAGDKGTPVGSSTSNVSSLLNPFASTGASISWPGTSVVDKASTGTGGLLLFQVVGVSAPGGTFRSPGGGYQLKAQGFKNPVPDYSSWPADAFRLSVDGTKPGYESTYAATRILLDNKNSTLGVPVGDFSPYSGGSAQSALSYVPLGAYQQVASTTNTGERLKPSVTGLGVVGARTTAIASIYSAGAWGQNAPVNAVRVRVSGIGAWNSAARSKVISVTQEIRDLGLKATIVAGSSPTNVQVRVNDYAFGVSSFDTPQKVGTVGQITQQWSELGAAARADTAVSGASLSTLGIALGSTALLLGAVQFVSIPRRRSEAAVMREIGWTRGRIRRWMLAEEIPAGLVVVAAGMAAVALSGLAQIAIIIASMGIVAVVLTSGAAVTLGGQGIARPVRARKSGRRRALRLRGHSTVAFGLRQAGIHTGNSITQAVAILIVAAAAAALTEVFLDGRVKAGDSLLAQFATGQTALYQILLGAVALVSGIVLLVLVRRVDLARRSGQWAALRAMGWTTPQLRSAQRTEVSAVAIPSVLLAAAASYGGAHLLNSPAEIGLMLSGAGAATVASLILLLVRRKAAAQ